MNENKCGEYADLINKVASGNASESEAEQLLLHAESCPECFAALEEATRISGIAEVKQTLSTEIKDKIKRSAPKKSRISRYVKVFGGIAAAAVIAIVVLTVGGGRDGMVYESAEKGECTPGDRINEGYSYSVNAPSVDLKNRDEKDGLNRNDNVESPSVSVSDETIKSDDRSSTEASEITEALPEAAQDPEKSVKSMVIESEKIPFDVAEYAAKEKISFSKYRFIAVRTNFDANKEIILKTVGIDCFTGTGICAQNGMKLYSNPYFESNYESDSGLNQVLVLENK